MQHPSKIEHLSPYIRLAWNHVTNAPWEMTERVIFDFELLYVKSGEIEVTIEDERYIGQPGDILYFRPGRRHTIRKISSSLFSQPHIHFDFFQDNDSDDVKISFLPLNQIPPDEHKLFRKDITDDFYPGFPSYIRLQNPKIIEQMILDIIEEYDSKLIYHQTILKGMFIQLWVQLLREVSLNENRIPPSNLEKFHQIKRYIDAHINQELYLDEISNTFYLNKYYLSHMFRRIFGVSPIGYHRMQRVGYAKKLMQFSKLSVTEVAAQLGYTNVHSFSRAFKAQEGVSPTFYRS